MNKPKMRTASKLASDYKSGDADTAVNIHFIRRLMASGTIPYVKSGKKFLINADALDVFLSGGQHPSIGKHEDGKMLPQ